jgi:hypothetical protein
MLLSNVSDTTEPKKHPCNLREFWIGRPEMRRDLLVPLMLATLVLAAIFVIAPKSTIVAYEASAEVYGVDIVRLTTNATGLPEQRFDTH